MSSLGEWRLIGSLTPPDTPSRVLVGMFGSGNRLQHGDNIDAAPVLRGTAGDLRALAFVSDAELGSLDTPFGSAEFIQIVGSPRTKSA